MVAVIQQMRTLLFIMLITNTVLCASDTRYVIRLSDPNLKDSEPIARITISDTTGIIIKRGFSNAAGCFEFNTSLLIVQIKVDSAQETCDGISMGHSQKLNLANSHDTIKIVLGHLWVDRWPLPLVFDDGSLLFRSVVDSTGAECDFTQPDPKCSGFDELDFLLHEFNTCGAWKRMEVISYYTTAESEQHGNKLALARADSCIAYLRAHGMKDVEFVVTPRFYPDRPLKNADGTFRTEEINLISFRILGW